MNLYHPHAGGVSSLYRMRHSGIAYVYPHSRRSTRRSLRWSVQNVTSARTSGDGNTQAGTGALCRLVSRNRRDVAYSRVRFHNEDGDQPRAGDVGDCYLDLVRLPTIRTVMFIVLL